MNVSLIELLTQAGNPEAAVQGAPAGKPAPSSQVFSALLQEFKGLHAEPYLDQGPAEVAESANASTSGGNVANGGVEPSEVVVAGVESGTDAQRVESPAETGDSPLENGDEEAVATPNAVEFAPGAGDGAAMAANSAAGVPARVNPVPAPKSAAPESGQGNRAAISESSEVAPKLATSHAVRVESQVPVDKPALAGPFEALPKTAVEAGSQGGSVRAVPATPATAATPAVPAAPATPAVPVPPAAPSTSGRLAASVTPAAPAVPAASVTPAAPAVPAASVTPAAPATSAASVTPVAPAIPEASMRPASPAAVSLPEAVGLPGAPAVTARPVAAIVPTASPSTEGETLASTATPLPSGIVAPKMSGPGVEPAALQNGGANTTAVSGANAVPNSQSGSERAVVLPTEGGAAQPMGQNAPAVTASVDRPSEFAARPAPAVQASVLASQSIRVSSPRARVEAAAAPLSESSTVALSGEETGDGEGAESIPRAQSPSSGRPATPAPRPGAPPNGTAIPGGANELAARPFVANTALADVKPNAATQAGVSRGTLVQSAVEILDLPVEARVASGASASGAADPLPASVATRAEPLSTVAPATSLPVPSEGGVESPASARPTLQTLGDFAVKSVRYLNARGGETIVVRLVPESLGELRIVVKSGSDGMEIELSSRTQVVRATLESQLPALREAFARDGADVARITVTAPSAFDAASDSSLGRPSSHAGNQAPSNGNGQGRGNAPSGNGYGAEGRSRNRAPSHDGALNVFA